MPQRRACNLSPQITPGTGEEFDVTAGEWYKIGVNNMQRDSGEDATVYIKVWDVKVRIMKLN